MSEFHVKIDHTQRGILVQLIGEGSLATADELLVALEQLLDRMPTLVVIDMSQLTFASSLVIGVIIKSRNLFKKHAGTLKLAAIQPRVRESFQHARLDWAVPIFDTVEQAFES